MPGFVQTSGKVQRTNISTSPQTVTMPAAFKRGNTGIFSFYHFGPGSSRVLTVTIGGKAATKIFDLSDGANVNHLEIWAAPQIENGAFPAVPTNSVSWTWSAAGHYLTGSIEEWDKLADGTIIDVSGTAGPTTSAAPSASATTTVADAVAYALYGDTTGVNVTSITAPSTYTSAWAEVDGSTQEAGSGAYKVLAAAGAQSPAFALGASTSWLAAVAALKSVFTGHGLAYHFINDGGSTITTPAFDSQGSGGCLIVSVGRQQVSEFTGNLPSDNKSSTFTQQGTSHTYSAWPTSGTAIYTASGVSGGSGHTVSVAKPTANDECTIIAVEVRTGSTPGTPVWNEDLTTATNTSGNVTTTGPATLVAFWWGADANGERNATASGWTRLDATDSLASNHVQVAAFRRRVESAGTYNIVVTPATAQAAQLYIVAVPDAASGPTITTQPVSAFAPVGGTASFSVSATASAGSLTYQWKKNGTNISGATSSSYTTPTLAAGDSGTLSVVVTDSNGSLTSVDASLTVYPVGELARRFDAGTNPQSPPDSAYPTQELLWTDGAGGALAALLIDLDTFTAAAGTSLVNSDLAGTYAANAFISADLAGTYLDTTAVSADLAGTFIATSAVSADLAGTFTAQSAVSSDLAGTFAAQAFVGANLAGTYIDADFVSADLAGTFTASAFVSSDLAGSFSASAFVSADLAGTYDANSATTVNSDLAGTYAANANVAQDLAGTFLAQSAVSADLAGTYLDLDAVSADLAGTYTAQIAVSADLAGTFSANALVSRDLVGTYTDTDAVSADLAGTYDQQSAGTVSNDLLGTYAANASVSTDLAGSYVATVLVGQNLAGTYTSTTAVSADLAGSFTAAANVAADLAGTFTAAGPIASDLAGSYQAQQFVAADLAGTYSNAGASSAVSADLAGGYSTVAFVTGDLVGIYTTGDLAGIADPRFVVNAPPRGLSARAGHRHLEART